MIPKKVDKRWDFDTAVGPMTIMAPTRKTAHMLAVRATEAIIKISEEAEAKILGVYKQFRVLNPDTGKEYGEQLQ